MKSKVSRSHNVWAGMLYCCRHVHMTPVSIAYVHDSQSDKAVDAAVLLVIFAILACAGCSFAAQQDPASPHPDTVIGIDLGTTCAPLLSIFWSDVMRHVHGMCWCE